MLLSDGTVIPSYMGVKNTSNARGAPGFFNEVAILAGEVVKVIYPDDSDSNSHRFMEYVVNVWRRQGSGAQERITFRCFQSDTFGSVADQLRFSFRAATNTTTQDPLSNGATVLVACVNGDRSNAYIIAAMPQPKRDADPPKAAGRYFRSRFNGVEMRVNDDGSFELTVPGATDADGNPDPNRDGSNKGSKLTIAANGDIVIDDQAGDSVKVSPSSKSIEVVSTEKMSEKTKEGTVTASASWKLKAPIVVVDSKDVRLGGDAELVDPTQGVVHGQGIDPFTGMPYFALGNTSTVVKAKKQ